LAESERVAAAALCALTTVAGCRADRLGAGLARRCERAGSQRGDATGKDPTNRGKLGTKRHLVVDRNGLPLAVTVSGANVHDSPVLEETVDAIPPVRLPHRQRGRPRQRPTKLHADKGYDYPRCRRALRVRGIIPHIARRGIESSERLGRYRGWWNGRCPG
jgi:IS5 family transposase